MPPEDTLRPVDNDARRLARSLLRTARFAALACLEPGTGHPLASRVSLATDLAGNPIFLISQLSAHFGALEADGRASILVGEPGKGDPLAHARMTVIGHARKLTGEQRTGTRFRFLSRHPKASLYADFPDFAFWQLDVERASLNGGFGKAFALAREDVLSPVCDGLDEAEPGILQHMNEDHAEAVEAYAGLIGAFDGNWQMTGIDAEGLDLGLGNETRRLWFETPLKSVDEVRPLLVALARKAKA
jgi:heme oxygenase (biliverdin-IX-beta and delta-forming)